MRALAPLLVLLATATLAWSPWARAQARGAARTVQVLASAPARPGGPRPHAVATAMVLAALLSSLRRRARQPGRRDARKPPRRDPPRAR